MAYLATYCSRPTVLSEPLRSNGVIAILNPLTPFAAGSGFSAQRVCKIFSVAVQVAYNEGKRLIMCQCESIRSSDGIIPGSESWSISIPLFASPPNTLEKGDSAKRVKLECIAKQSE
ncbi:hypothetical protein KEM54_002330 [Ascosphaera aggregata]|nr:hypothetical protein KEM54_002330 [Ascosphaera aggregata]